jgi:protein AroM
MKTSSRLGVLTIGQSPRGDVLPEFLPLLSPDTQIVQRGALDGLSKAEIEALRPEEGDYTLVTRLLDGSEVRLAERLILARMRRCVKKLEEGGAQLIALFCTGEFPDLGASVPILRPDRILGKIISALLPEDGKLCVIAPVSEQIPAMIRKWSRDGRSVHAEAVSPYSATEGELELAAQRAAKSPCDLVVLDCIGYTGKARSIFRESLHKPVLLPRTVLGRIAAEMLEG